MSIEVMTLVWKSAPYEGNTLLTLLALADWSNELGESWPAVETLAKKSRQGERNCRYALRRMEKDGYLKTTPRKDDSSIYRINIKKLHGGQILPPEGQSTAEGGQVTAPKVSQIAPYTSDTRQEKHTSSNIGPVPSFELTPSEPINSSGVTLKQIQQSSLYTWVPFDAWKSWEEMRIKIKKPLTDRARQQAVDRLHMLTDRDTKKATDLIDEATNKCWLKFYTPFDYESSRAGVTQPENMLDSERKRIEQFRQKRGKAL